MFACSLAGEFLPIQLIYQGRTTKCLPKGVTFPEDWHLTYTSNHWSNETTTIEYVNSIILSYITSTRKKLGLQPTHPALVLFDAFKGKCTDGVLKLLEKNNIFYVMVPPNCTDRLQPLDLSINKPAKHFMKRKFQEWYASVVLQQLEDGVNESVDLRLTIMNPLMAKWIIDMHHYFTSRSQLIVSGFTAAGITKILQE